MAVEKPSAPDRAAYQREWEQQLGGGSTTVLVGILFALLVFISLGCLPWVLSYLQDAEIIKPRLHLRIFDEMQAGQRGSEPAPEGSPDSQPADFGQPRK